LNRVLAIGDALHTDIAGAQAMGLDSLLITTGIHRDELYDQTGEWREDAYARLLAEHGVAPDARMSRLSW
jgi:ribonucleotide monophosphatase NagD (HAD superfamily)